MEACRACCTPRFWSGCARGGLAPTRLGGPEGDGLVRAEAPPPPPRLGHAGGARGVQKKLEQAVAEARAQHPDKPIEVWATDEHRIGLRPIIRRVWAPKGQRPIALGHHRYKWLYVTAFVQPTLYGASDVKRFRPRWPRPDTAIAPDLAEG